MGSDLIDCLIGGVSGDKGKSFIDEIRKSDYHLLTFYSHASFIDIMHIYGNTVFAINDDYNKCNVTVYMKGDDENKRRNAIHELTQMTGVEFFR